MLMDITKITKITGDYNNVRPYLFVDKVMGGVNFCRSSLVDEVLPEICYSKNKFYIEIWKGVLT